MMPLIISVSYYWKRLSRKNNTKGKTSSPDVSLNKFPHPKKLDDSMKSSSDTILLFHSQLHILKQLARWTSGTTMSNYSWSELISGSNLQKFSISSPYLVEQIMAAKYQRYSNMKLNGPMHEPAKCIVCDFEKIWSKVKILYFFYADMFPFVS